MPNLTVTPTPNLNSLMVLLARKRLAGVKPDSFEHLEEVVKACPVAGRIHAGLPVWATTMSRAHQIINDLCQGDLFFRIKEAKLGLNDLGINTIFVGKASVSDVMEALYHAYGDLLATQTDDIYPLGFIAALKVYELAGNELSVLEKQITECETTATDILNEFFQLPTEQIELLINSRIIIGHHEAELRKAA
ncbi:MAG: hypothetical protein A3B68_03850 [Candidatus Melainabacteria bacterium RIFCSPHIGHO2_02_FULL_34_12]|nr:MAG: hypothetical protein A3B68_03850 [Candidatus Melainabacteria bacterium RIFCSPHIGHO2_02_FULL_34_12]